MASAMSSPVAARTPLGENVVGDVVESQIPNTQERQNEWEEMITVSEIEHTEAEPEKEQVQLFAKELMKFWARPKAAIGVQESDVNLSTHSPAIKTMWRRTCRTLQKAEEAKRAAQQPCRG